MVGHAVLSAGTVVTRFAPSPTGLLHLGHGHAAVVAWRRARAAGGRFLLRLEDIDPQRCRPQFAAAAEADLGWLGVEWDGPVRTQSAHLGAYRAVLEALAAQGLVYPCFCSRAEVARELAATAAAPHDPDGTPLYPGTCRGLSAAERTRRGACGQAPAWRLDMTRALREAPALSFVDGPNQVRADPACFGDVVLARRDAPVSYHLCSVHDDAVQGVTLVTRAADLRPATHLHRLLQHLMGWPAPDYEFFPLLTGPDGQRLSKRDGARSLRSYREAGHTPAETLGLIAQLAQAARDHA